MDTLIFNYGELDSVMGFNISDHSFFSTGVTLMFDGQVYELIEIIGDSFIFESIETNDETIKEALDNVNFFYSEAV